MDRSKRGMVHLTDITKDYCGDVWGLNKLKQIGVFKLIEAIRQFVFC